MKRLSRRRVRRLRKWIANNRCPARPGLTHDWSREVEPDMFSFGGGVSHYYCLKCGAA